MRYCHELLFDDLDNIAREQLEELIAYHASKCVRDDDDAWDWQWGHDRVVIHFWREADMVLSARTLAQQHDCYTDQFCIFGHLYHGDAIYTVRPAT